MLRFSIVHSLLLIVFLLIIQAALPAQPSIPKSVLANGGHVSQNSAFKITGTVGQALIGSAGSPTDSLKAGYWFVPVNVTSDIRQQVPETPGRYQLRQNYPNPFNEQTTIEYDVKEACHVVLTLSDIRGTEVAVLVDEERQPGSYGLTFVAHQLASGVYFYRIKMDDFQAIRKMILLR